MTSREERTEAEELISVIVPVYNVEAYIERCIQSILAQSYRRLEIILVNDGSTDRSPELCKVYEQQDQRVRVYTRANGGLSEARNTGIDASHGDYLVFVDGDDYIHPEMIETLYRQLRKYRADLALCRIRRVPEGGEASDGAETSCVRVDLTTGTELFRQLTDPKRDSTELVVAYNKLYPRKLFAQLRYPAGKINEDEFVIHHILCQAPRAAVVEQELYYYVQRPESIMHAHFSERRFHYLEALQDRLSLCLKRDLFVREMLYFYFVAFLALLRRYEKYNPRNQAVRRRYVRIYRNEKKKYRSAMPPSLRLRLSYREVRSMWIGRGVFWFRLLLKKLVERREAGLTPVR